MDKSFGSGLSWKSPKTASDLARDCSVQGHAVADRETPVRVVGGFLFAAATAAEVVGVQ